MGGICSTQSCVGYVKNEQVFNLDANNISKDSQGIQEELSSIFKKIGDSKDMEGLEPTEQLKSFIKENLSHFNSNPGSIASLLMGYACLPKNVVLSLKDLGITGEEIKYAELPKLAQILIDSAKESKVEESLLRKVISELRVDVAKSLGEALDEKLTNIDFEEISKQDEIGISDHGSKINHTFNSGVGNWGSKRNSENSLVKKTMDVETTMFKSAGPKYLKDLEYIYKQTGKILDVDRYIKANGTTELDKDEEAQTKPDKYLRIFGREPGHGIKLFTDLDEIKNNPDRGWIGSLSSAGRQKCVEGLKFFANDKAWRNYKFIICDSDPGSSDYGQSKDGKISTNPTALKKNLYDFIPDVAHNYGDLHTQTAFVAIPDSYFR